MTERHPRADLITALAEGKTLQIKGSREDDRHFRDYEPTGVRGWNALINVDSPYKFRIKPEHKTGWVNVYDNNIHHHATREEADKYASKARIACVKWTEGEGL